MKLYNNDCSEMIDLDKASAYTYNKDNNTLNVVVDGITKTYTGIIAEQFYKKLKNSTSTVDKKQLLKG